MKALLRSSPPQAFQCTVWPLALSRISAHGLVSAARQGSARATNAAATAADSLIVGFLLRAASLLARLRRTAKPPDRSRPRENQSATATHKVTVVPRPRSLSIRSVPPA